MSQLRLGLKTEDPLVETKYCTIGSSADPFLLESGLSLGPITVAYETYGELNAQGTNAVLIVHALTGDAHAAGKYHFQEKSSGWWDPSIGPGRPFDTNKYFVICSNVLGGCTGTTGPSSVNPKTGQPYAMEFPLITIRDMVAVQKKFLDYLGISRLVTVAGGSMGGMQVLEWAVMYPDFMDSIITIAAPGRLSPQGIAFNEVAREAIMLDPCWNQGNYYDSPQKPACGLKIARMLGTITYKSDQSMNQRFGRNLADEHKRELELSDKFAVESYLQYQGQKLVQRFDANSYLYLTKAMDLHDLGRNRSSYEEALAAIKARVLSVGISSDFLFPAYQQKEIVKILQAHNRRGCYREINSPHGHDAFLIEFQKLNKIMKDFLEKLI